MPKLDYSFAREANSVPLTAAEFPSAQASFPIAFTTDPTPMGLAVLGLRTSENLFVDAEGAWRRDSYVPAFVRRYPYVFVQAEGDDRYVLCVDEAAPHYSPDGGEPFFDGEKATAQTERALQFCAEFQGHAEQTTKFVNALQEHNLLVPNEATVTLEDGRKLVLGGFSVVDEARFNVLPDQLHLEWRRLGWLPLIYAHLMSMQRWTLLASLSGEKTANDSKTA